MLRSLLDRSLTNKIVLEVTCAERKVFAPVSAVLNELLVVNNSINVVTREKAAKLLNFKSTFY